MLQIMLANQIYPLVIMRKTNGIWRRWGCGFDFFSNCPWNLKIKIASIGWSSKTIDFCVFIQWPWVLEYNLY